MIHYYSYYLLLIVINPLLLLIVVIGTNLANKLKTHPVPTGITCHKAQKTCWFMVVGTRLASHQRPILGYQRHIAVTVGRSRPRPRFRCTVNCLYEDFVFE